MGPSASRRPGPTTCCRHLAGSSYARKRQGGVLSFDTHAIIRSMRQGNCKGNKRSSRPIWGAQPPVTASLSCCPVRSPFSLDPRHFPASFPLFHPIPPYSRGMPHGRSRRSQTSRYTNVKLPNEPILKMTPSLSISGLQTFPLSGPEKTNPFCSSLRLRAIAPTQAQNRRQDTDSTLPRSAELHSAFPLSRRSVPGAAALQRSWQIVLSRAWS
jgi:hypothetical protein